MKNYIKNLLKDDSYLYMFISYVYNWYDKYWQPLKYDDLKNLILIYSKEYNNVLFIQVGSNDGISNDPLNRFIKEYNWSGYCIEPIPENFKKLETTYIDNCHITLLNKAIGSSGTIKLYCINAEKAKLLGVSLPSWYNQLASFDKDLVVADIKGNNKYEIIDEIEVSSITFTELISGFKINYINILHIDVEGADWKILSSFPFKKLKPQIIIFEHNHLSLKDYKTAVTFLRSINYKLLKVGTDTFAYLNHKLFKPELKYAYKFFKRD